MLINGLTTPVFDLSKVDQYMRDYYIDRDGAVYSMKSGKATRMQGSTTISGRYLTLNKRTHRADDVFRKAKAHPHFAAETSPNHVLAQAPAKESGLPAGRSRSAKMLVGAKGFLLASIGPTDKLVFGTEPVFHLTEPTAKEEAERVAAQSGKTVVLLKVVGAVKVQKAVWE